MPAFHYTKAWRNSTTASRPPSASVKSAFSAEVFGHARGAFADAKEKFPGLVEQAASGTLFLDEIDSLQPRAQASLLRFLQDRIYRPPGSTQVITGQCAILAATNKSLEQLVVEGRFREDLLYRLNTI
ncbi:MAG: sigma 54-interacting transcriptional regulator, partial [Methylococcales bacterium]